MLNTKISRCFKHRLTIINKQSPFGVKMRVTCKSVPKRQMLFGFAKLVRTNNMVKIMTNQGGVLILMRMPLGAHW
jgi:hypothetical protein